MDAASSVEYFVLLRRQLLEVLQLTPESDAVFGIIKDLKLGNASFVRFGRLLLLAALPFLGGLHLFRLLSDELNGLLAGSPLGPWKCLRFPFEKGKLTGWPM